MQKVKYTIYNITAMPHDIDDDIIHFEFDVDVTEPERFTFSYFYPFNYLLKYIKETDFAFYKFITETRNSLDMWGPAETQTVQALGEEGIKQLYKALEECFDKNEYIAKDFAYFKRLSHPTPKQTQEYKKKFEVLSEGVPAIKESTNKSRQFCNQVQKNLRDIAFNVYPEIADLPSEKLIEFKRLFVNEILQIKERLETFLYTK